MQKYLVFLLVLIFANCQPKEEVMPKHELLSLYQYWPTTGSKFLVDHLQTLYRGNAPI